MDVFLMIRRKRITIFTDAKESTSVRELKQIIKGITKFLPDDQKLFKDKEEMLDGKVLLDYGLSGSSARAQSPATVGLACRQDNGDFETLEIIPLSIPPELPDVMKPQEAQQHEQTA